MSAANNNYITPDAAARLARIALCTLAAALSGCTIYSALPLPKGNDLADRVALPVPALDMDTVATLAVLNSPDLKAQRATMHVAEAQAFAAGLLPDPSFSYSYDHPYDRVIDSTDPRYPEYNAYGLGLSVDLQTLLTHRSTHAAATASLEQARLNLLWQEWQTVAAARTLYAQQAIAEQRRSYLEAATEIYAQAAQNAQRALAAGNVTIQQVSTDRAVLIDLQAQLGTAERSLLTAQQGLRTLLGVQPEVAIPLQPIGLPPVPDRAALTASVARSSESRPDLRALQAGYRSQEEQVRTAVLQQFPDVSVGVTRARDVSNVHTIGLTATLTLPIFDRGRGKIAVQRATRAQLFAEYQARLDQTTGDAWQLWNEMQQLNGQLTDLDQRLPELQSSVDAARAAYLRGEFPPADFFTLVSSYLGAQATRFDLLQSLWSDSIALSTLIGGPLPAAVNGSDPGH